MEKCRDEQKKHFGEWIVNLSGEDVNISNEDVEKFDHSVKIVKDMIMKMFKVDNSK